MHKSSKHRLAWSVKSLPLPFPCPLHDEVNELVGNPSDVWSTLPFPASTITLCPVLPVGSITKNVYIRLDQV